TVILATVKSYVTSHKLLLARARENGISMHDETKGNIPPTSPGTEHKPATQPASPQDQPGASGEKQAAALGAGPPPPPKPAGPTPMPWDSEMVARLKERFGSGIRE